MMLMTMGLAAAASASCYNIDAEQPKRLTGLLTLVTFPGPPNYEDVRKGDRADRTFILRLATPICVTSEMGGRTAGVREVQLGAEPRLRSTLAAAVGKQVTVGLSDQRPQLVGDDHAPLRAAVSAVIGSSPVVRREGTGSSAIAVVRGFYAALRAGRGDLASQLVVPEKRNLPAFSASGLTAFYAHLSKPIELVDARMTSPTAVDVRYRYAAGQRFCDGRATVETTRRIGRPLIEHIRTIDGC